MNVEDSTEEVHCERIRSDGKSCPRSSSYLYSFTCDIVNEVIFRGSIFTHLGNAPILCIAIPFVYGPEE